MNYTVHFFFLHLQNVFRPLSCSSFEEPCPVIKSRERPHLVKNGSGLDSRVTARRLKFRCVASQNSYFR